MNPELLNRLTLMQQKYPNHICLMEDNGTWYSLNTTLPTDCGAVVNNYWYSTSYTYVAGKLAKQLVIQGNKVALASELTNANAQQPIPITFQLQLF